MTSWAYAKRLAFFAIVAGTAFGCAEQFPTDPTVTAEGVSLRRFYDGTVCRLQSYTAYSSYYVCESYSGSAYPLPPVIVSAPGAGAYMPPTIPDDCYYNDGGMCDPNMCYEMPGGCGGSEGQAEPGRPSEISEADWSRLNWKEKLLCAAAPFPCIINLTNAVTSLDWAAALAAAAGASGHNDKYDAMRHVLWSALNTRDMGEVAARKWGDAHELSSDNRGETCMDLRNNALGIQLAIEKGFQSDNSYKNFVVQMQNLQIGTCGFFE